MNLFKGLFGSDETYDALPAETGNARDDVTDAKDDLREAVKYAIHKLTERNKLTEEEKWEQRRWELTRYLVSQDRRSVVLGKLQASPKTIASKARELADATINELLNNPRSFNNGKRTDATTE